MVFENCVKMLENGQTTALKCRILLMYWITIILARLLALFTLSLTRLEQRKILKHFSFLLNYPITEISNTYLGIVSCFGKMKKRSCLEKEEECFRTHLPAFATACCLCNLKAMKRINRCNQLYIKNLYLFNLSYHFAGLISRWHVIYAFI